MLTLCTAQHVLSLPSLKTIRMYHAHSASVTSISISPPPPPPSVLQPRSQKNDRNVLIATSGIDGLVVIVPLLPSAPPQLGQNSVTMNYARTEITVKNFKRPVLAIALSPNFRIDRTFLSGGLAGNLVLSVVPPSGASGGGWMTLGLGGGKDTILHSGEGTISAIAWSKESPRFVAWTNEQGIKIMRSHITPPNLHKNGSEELAGNPGVIGWIPGLGVGGILASEVAWKRISAFERPESISEELAAAHKPRLQWVDRRTLSPEDLGEKVDESQPAAKCADWGERERLLVSWGNTVWVMDVFTETAGDDDGQQKMGRAELLHILQTDCTIAGIHMYTPSLLLILAYVTATSDDGETETADDDPEPTASGETEATTEVTTDDPTAMAKVRRGRTSALTPELRMIDIHTSEEVSADELAMSRFESLSVGDYHLDVLPMTPPSNPQSDTGEAVGIGGNIWAAGINATQYFAGAAGNITQTGISATQYLAGAAGSFKGSSRSAGSDSPQESGSSKSIAEKERGGRSPEAPWGEDEKGTKIYIISPFDVVFATERSPKDHLHWELEHERYEQAWDLVERYPEIIAENNALNEYDEEERRVVADSEDGYETESTISSGKKRAMSRYSAAEKEKRRIGELWLKKLIKEGAWVAAGDVCGKVLGTSTRWEHWVWVFEAAGKIPEIMPYIPRKQLSPPLPTVIYEIVLAHYLNKDLPMFRELLLETWKPQPERARSLYDPQTIIDAIMRKLNNREDNVYEGDKDWRLLQECLARLFIVVGDPRNALRRYIILKHADEAFRLIREYRLVDTIRDDIPSVILLRVSPKQLKSASIGELESTTTEAITLLVDEADRGILSPQAVVSQLKNPSITAGRVFLFFYLRRLWRRTHTDNKVAASNIGTGGLLSEFGDLIVELFAEYDRPLLMEFLVNSQTYSLEKAMKVCERRKYIPELVHLLSKTGQMKRALFLIIDKLGDVEQAISFVKAQNDPDLWGDLLDYSMDKPPFIRGLLENVGTAIDPITLIRRIPMDLEIEGLKDALAKILREYAVQWSICDGVAKVMRSEVSRGMERLRGGQRRGVRVEVAEASEPVVPNAVPRMKPAKVGIKGGACGECKNEFCGSGKRASFKRLFYTQKLNKNKIYQITRF